MIVRNRARSGDCIRIVPSCRSIKLDVAIVRSGDAIVRSGEAIADIAVIADIDATADNANIANIDAVANGSELVVAPARAFNHCPSPQASCHAFFAGSSAFAIVYTIVTRSVTIAVYGT